MEEYINKYRVEAAAMTICGPNRQENQDALVFNGRITQKPILMSQIINGFNIPITYSVVDGMGGYTGGSDAACIAATTLAKYNLDYKNIHDADDTCTNLSNKILKAGQAWGTPEMGAVFAMLTLNENMFAIANIGDSRIYRYDAQDDFLTQLSEDDCSTSGSGALTQSLGYIDCKLDAHGFYDNLRDNDRFLICSDGVWGTLDEEEIRSIIANNYKSTDTIKDLTRLCIDKNTSDNCSAIYVKVDSLEEGENNEW